MVCLRAFLVWSSVSFTRLLLAVTNPAVWQKNPLNRFFILLLYTWFHPPPLVILMANIGFVSSWMQTFRCDRYKKKSIKPAKFRAFTPNIEVQLVIMTSYSYLSAAVCSLSWKNTEENVGYIFYYGDCDIILMPDPGTAVFLPPLHFRFDWRLRPSC